MDEGVVTRIFEETVGHSHIVILFLLLAGREYDGYYGPGPFSCRQGKK